MSECCGGTCRLAEIRRMTEDELMDALVNAEEERDMAIAEVDRLYPVWRAVLAAPHIWWCEVRYMGFTGTASACATHAKCGWKRLVDDPQEGGEDG